jgi:hypothetical protein
MRPLERLKKHLNNRKAKLSPPEQCQAETLQSKSPNIRCALDLDTGNLEPISVINKSFEEGPNSPAVVLRTKPKAPNKHSHRDTIKCSADNSPVGTIDSEILALGSSLADMLDQGTMPFADLPPSDSTACFVLH